MKKKTKTTRYFGVRAPEELYEKLSARAKAERRSFGSLIVLLMEQEAARMV